MTSKKYYLKKDYGNIEKFQFTCFYKQFKEIIMFIIHNFSVARFNSSDYFKQESNGQSKARLGQYLVGKSFGKSF